MNTTLWRTIAVLVVFTVVCSARAHDLPMNAIMNAFVKVDSDHVDLVVRVPLDLLRGVPFPVRDSAYDVASAGPASEVALLLLEDGFVILENGVALKPSTATARLSPQGERSFGTFESAVALVQRPSDDSAPIVYDKGYFDVHYAYAIRSPKSLFQLQSHVAADLGSGAMLTVRYLSANDTGRALIVRSGDEPEASD